MWSFGIVEIDDGKCFILRSYSHAEKFLLLRILDKVI